MMRLLPIVLILASAALIAAPSVARAEDAAWLDCTFGPVPLAATVRLMLRIVDDQMAGERAEEWREKMAAIGWTDEDMRRRWAVLAVPDRFIRHPDTQHGHQKFFVVPAKAGAEAGGIWVPPHPPATTYQVAMSHAWADGRLFLRGADAIYGYDLRQPDRRFSR